MIIKSTTTLGTPTAQPSAPVIADIRLNDFGWIHEIQVNNESDDTAFDLTGIDLTGALLMSPRDGSTKIATPAFVTPPGLDGLLRYTVPPGTYDKTGQWKVYIRVKRPGQCMHTRAIRINVQSL